MDTVTRDWNINIRYYPNLQRSLSVPTDQVIIITQLQV